MRFNNFTLLNAIDTSNYNSNKIDANQLISASFAVHFSDSTVDGTIKVQASNDPCAAGYLPDAFTPTHWVDIPQASATVTNGSSALIVLTQITYRWMRAVWTRTSDGSGNILINFNALSV